MRVEVKKINAALKVSSVSLKKRKRNPLKKLFRDAGGIRDTQVGLELIEQWCPENQVLKGEQNEQLRVRSEAFYLKMPDYVKDDVQFFKVVSKKLHAVKNRRLLKWYSKQFKQVGNLLAAQQIEQNLHLCRKKIKDILYGYGLVKNTLASQLPVNTNYLDRLQEKIGKWHDTVSTLEFLSSQSSVNRPVVTKLNGLRKRQIRSLASFSADFKCKALTLPTGRDRPAKQTSMQ